MNNKLMAILCIGILQLSCNHKPQPVILTEYLLQHHLQTDTCLSNIHTITNYLLSQTFFKGKVNINKAFAGDSVNIYLINGKQPGVYTDDHINGYCGNCQYIGNNIIILDINYLQSFLTTHHVTIHANDDYLKDDQESLLYWVIGHELGHLVCKHPAGALDSGKLDRMVKTSTIDNRQELQADSFFVAATLRDPVLRNSVDALMINMLNAEIEQKIGKIDVMGVGLIFDYTDQKVVSYTQQPVHPEFVIRLSRMLELSAKMGGDVALYNLIQEFIRQLKENNGSRL